MYTTHTLSKNDKYIYIILLILLYIILLKIYIYTHTQLIMARDVPQTPEHNETKWYLKNCQQNADSAQTLRFLYG